MVNVENLSDAELRTKLIEYGFPVMPITNTTRRIMVMKLKLLMENKNKTNADNRRSLGRYSSEEESDAESKTKKKDKNRRATMGVPSMQPPATNKLPVRKSSQRINDNNVDVSAKKEKVITTKIVTSEENDFDTGSDSEPDTYSFKKVETSSPLSFYSSSKTESAEVPVTKSSPCRYSYTTSTTASDYAADRLNSIRARLSLGNSDGRSNYTSDTYEVNNDEIETPFLSNFTKRLSKISAEKKGADYKNDLLEGNETNGSNFARNYLNKPLRHRDFTRSYNANKENASKNNLVSFTVIGLAFLFFVVVGVVYLGLHSGNSALETIGNEVPYCSANENIKLGFDCIMQDDYPHAINFYRLLKPELLKRAVAHKCENPSAKPYMTERDIINYVSTNTPMKDETDIQTHLTNFQILIFANPLWSISIIPIEDSGEIGTTPIENMQLMVKFKTQNEIALIVSNPELPWSCSLYLKIARMFNAILVLAILSLTVYGANVALKYYKRYKQKEKDEMFRIIGRIVDILQTNATDDPEKNFLAINHVRDMILPYEDRKSKQNVWSKAVKFISENDSRIRTEIQVVQGEPYEVWRWLGAPNLNASRSRTWQGQAFETQVGSVNSLQCSPTPCLKIRGMVEDGDRNLHTIREAVLSKCAHQCKILHCAVDTNSKCVYLKCADQSDAAVSYRNLHGWWYAGHLVTVKYLRLERYMQRYPDSPVNGPPFLKALQPATDWNI